MIDYTNQNVCANCLNCKVVKGSGVLPDSRAYCAAGKWGLFTISRETKTRLVRGLSEGPNIAKPDCDKYDPVESKELVNVVLKDIRTLKHEYAYQIRLTSKA